MSRQHKRGRRHVMSIRLEPSVFAALQDLARARQMSMNAYLNEALRAHFEECGTRLGGEPSAQRAEIVYEQRQLRGLVEALGEQMRLFVLTWLSHHPALPTAERSAAIRAARARFEAFEAELLRRLHEPAREATDGGSDR